MGTHSKIDVSFLLRDEELADHLRSGRTVMFRGLGQEWHSIEKQVERLGFGDLYFVSQVAGRERSIKLSPASVASTAQTEAS